MLPDDVKSKFTDFAGLDDASDSGADDVVSAFQYFTCACAVVFDNGTAELYHDWGVCVADALCGANQWAHDHISEAFNACNNNPTKQYELIDCANPYLTEDVPGGQWHNRLQVSYLGVPIAVTCTDDGMCVVDNGEVCYCPKPMKLSQKVNDNGEYYQTCECPDGMTAGDSYVSPAGYVTHHKLANGQGRVCICNDTKLPMAADGSCPKPPPPPPPKCERGQYLTAATPGKKQVCKKCDDPDSYVADNTCQPCPQGTQSDGNNNCVPICPANSIYQALKPLYIPAGPGAKSHTYRCVSCGEDEQTVKEVGYGGNWSVTKTFCQHCPPGYTRSLSDPECHKHCPLGYTSTFGKCRKSNKKSIPPPGQPHIEPPTLIRCPPGKTPSADGTFCLGSEPPALRPPEQRDCTAEGNAITDRRSPDRCIQCPAGRVANAAHTSCIRVATPPQPPQAPQIVTPPPPNLVVRPPTVHERPRVTRPPARRPTTTITRATKRPQATVHRTTRVSRPVNRPRHTITRPHRPQPHRPRGGGRRR
jgi:hypothetical protein